MHILGPATHFDLKDYVSGCLAIAGKDLILLNNGVRDPVNPVAFCNRKCFSLWFTRGITRSYKSKVKLCVLFRMHSWLGIVFNSFTLIDKKCKLRGPLSKHEGRCVLAPYS